MSVLIKGMGMPESCEDCSAQIIDPTGGASGCAVNHSIILRKRGERRPTECPLVEVPKHGRLIDAEKMKKYIRENTFQSRCLFVGKPFWNSVWEEIVGDVCYDIDTMPTIIEEEE